MQNSAKICRGGTGIEIGVESSERSKAMNAILGEGELMNLDTGISGQKVINLEKSSKDLITIFQYSIFGISDVSKKDAEVIAREKGWIEIMKKTWFCFTPVNGKPCGICNPCKDAMNEGMEWRMPYISQFRYKHMQNRVVCRIIHLHRKIFGI